MEDQVTSSPAKMKSEVFRNPKEKMKRMAGIFRHFNKSITSEEK
jgi:hypothetical protein